MKALALLHFLNIFILVLSQDGLTKKERKRGKEYLSAKEIAKLGPLHRHDNKIELEQKCDSEFLRSFNLFGRTQAIPTHLVFCPHVKMSCCSKKDQMAIYENWVLDREKEILEKQFEKIKTNLEDFFKAAERVNYHASLVIKSMHDTPNNECKLMARRILTFQIPEMSKLILKKTEESHDFMKQVYKGFYCSICDVENHKFIDPQSRKIIISHKFCRSIITNTLTQLLYYKVHFPRFINLVTMFVGTCDASGRFIEEKIPETVIQTVDKGLESELRSCFDSKNTPVWINNCRQICESWNQGKVDEFFVPDPDALEVVTEYLKKQEGFFAGKAQQTRILKEKKIKESKKQQKLKETKKIKQSPVVSKKKEQRKLENEKSKIKSKNPLIQDYQEEIFPDFTDSRGYPTNLTNFTNFGLNKTAVEYVMFVERTFKTNRPSLESDSEPSTNVYWTQNKTFNLMLDNFKIEVKKNGTDFYRDGQFTTINFDLVFSILQKSDQRKLKKRMLSKTATVKKQAKRKNRALKKTDKHEEKKVPKRKNV